MPQAPQHSEQTLSNEYSWVALALSATAGATDGVAYLLLFHIFTSHMSGNTVNMMIAVAGAHWREAWRHLEPIVVFFAGIIVGIVLSDALLAKRVARMFSVIAGLEAALLIVFLLLAHPAHQWMVVWPAAAMGIQNAMLRRVGHYKVRTTFITGMITNAAQGLVEAVQALWRHSSDAHEKWRDCAFYSAIWLCFAAGGILGAYLELAHGNTALLLPLSGLGVLIAVDLAHPLTSAPVEQASGD